MPKMKYRVVVSDKASADLLEIGLYLSDESPAVSMRVLRRLRAAAAELGDRAMRFSLVPRHEGAGFRRRVVGSYNIYYRVRGDVVDVMHVLHGARDAGPLIFGGD